MRQRIGTWLCPGLIIAVLLLIQSGPVLARDYTVMVATWRGCEDACQGFQEYLGEKGQTINYLLRDAGKQESALPAILKEARTTGVDLIVSWGTSVTRGIAGTLAELDDPAFNHDIPQVFMIVADPVGVGIIKSLDETGRANLTGTYNRVPERVTIETIRTYLPEFKHLGMLFNTEEPNSLLKRDEMADLSAQMGFKLTALEIAQGADGKPRVDDIAPKLAQLKAAGAEFLYVGSSSFLRSNGETLANAAIKSQLPVFSPYEQMVRKGMALISVAARYREVGRLAGKQAAKILFDGAHPGDLPVARMTNFAVTVNLSVAKALKFFPPINLLQIAETVN